MVPTVIDIMDHKLIISRNFLEKNPSIQSMENLIIMEAEPTAENLLIYIKKILHRNIPQSVRLTELRLYETKDSYAIWINNDTGS
ncbi:MAG: 6-carboxytetrahydropterin synthase [Bacteroidia bacterium]|nr:6-carboxytetrahydropterin synthase [Bacteroidia bacterium]